MLVALLFTMKMETSYILLGEGDYTYSLDACRYLTSSSSLSSSSSTTLLMDGTTNDKRDSENSTVQHHHHHHRITCTGIDTLEELRTKYHDIEFVLNKLHSYNHNNKGGKMSLQGCCGANNNIVTTNVIHGVNAVGSSNANIIITNGSGSSSSGYDHVIFNHPHIGTENVKLHSQFLSHLFHTSNEYWMKSGSGLLHLTLVLGQCERWDCIFSAAKHDLILLRRDKFIPPPPPTTTTTTAAAAAAGAGAGAVNDYGNGGSSKSNTNNNSTTYYNLRRHQSGRSFANRRSMNGNGGGDSETLVFGRVCDHHSLSDDDDKCNTSRFLLPWECDTSFFGIITDIVSNDESNNVGSKSDKHNNNSSNNNNDNNNSTLYCKYCNNNKSFREYRSLRNHLLSLHPTCDEMHSLLDTNVTKKKKMKRKMDNLNNDKKRKSLSKSDNYDEEDDKCQEMTQQQQQHEPLHHCNDTVLICPTTYTCSLCDTGRIFPNKDALVSHQRATHFGKHKDIKPDWYRQEDVHEIRNNDKEAGCNDIANKSQVNCEMHCCQICDRQFVTGMDEVIHALEFVPSSSAIAKTIMMECSENVNNDNISVVIHPTSPVMYKCVYCSKSFTQVRAQRQHENFCSSRQQSEQSTIT